jgi:hypothetical protein
MCTGAVGPGAGREREGQMHGLKGTKNHDLAALHFKDEATFRSAARRAAGADIPVDAPGRNTLIVRTSDTHLFVDLSPETEPIPETGKISDAERSSLRRRLG